MKRILLILAMVATLVVTSFATPSSADARPRGWYGGYRGNYGYRPYYGNYYRPYYGRYYRSYYYPRYYGNYYYPGYYYGGYYPGYYGYGWNSPGVGISFGRGGVYFY